MVRMNITGSIESVTGNVEDVATKVAEEIESLSIMECIPRSRFHVTVSQVFGTEMRVLALKACTMQATTLDMFPDIDRYELQLAGASVTESPMEEDQRKAVLRLDGRVIFETEASV